MFDLTDYSEYLQAERDEQMAQALEADLAQSRAVGTAVSRFATDAEQESSLALTLEIMASMGMLSN